MLPADVQTALDTLVEYGMSRADASYEHPERLRAWMSGAVQAQIEDPDYEQAEEVELSIPTKEAAV